MNKTKIEYADYTWNPIVGCKRGCPYCYARKIHQRFYPNIPFEQIVNYDERLEQPLKIKKPSRIFIGSMSDIEYWSPAQMNNVLEIIKQCPQHIFLFLTKNGSVYGNYDFPSNCWLGVSSTGGEKYRFVLRRKYLNLIFLSLEPLLKEPTGLWFNSLIDWIIVGGLTPKPVHKAEWITNILKTTDEFKIPVFIKDNAKYPIRRQEFPMPKERR